MGEYPAGHPGGYPEHTGERSDGAHAGRPGISTAASPADVRRLPSRRRRASPRDAVMLLCEPHGKPGMKLCFFEACSWGRCVLCNIRLSGSPRGLQGFPGRGGEVPKIRFSLISRSQKHHNLFNGVNSVLIASCSFFGIGIWQICLIFSHEINHFWLFPGCRIYGTNLERN